MVLKYLPLRLISCKKEKIDNYTVDKLGTILTGWSKLTSTMGDRWAACAPSCNTLRRLLHHLCSIPTKVYILIIVVRKQTENKKCSIFFKGGGVEELFFKNVNVRKDKERLGNFLDLR